jgi:hypothetical protein
MFGVLTAGCDAPRPEPKPSRWSLGNALAAASRPGVTPPFPCRVSRASASPGTTTGDTDRQHAGHWPRNPATEHRSDTSDAAMLTLSDA